MTKQLSGNPAKNKSKFSLEKLTKWLNGDPHKDAVLILEVPLKASTLGRIKSGNYKPSELMGNAIMAIIEKQE